jgi:alpha-galactosidase
VDIKAICPWNPDNVGLDERKAAAQAYYNSIATLYASWGVDFVKADCLASKPYSGSDIRMLSDAPNLWRISNDVWDLWNGAGEYPKGLADIFPLAARWAPEARSGAWPDADMLAIGYLGPAPGWGVARRSRLSAAEQLTLLTLWCVSRSPLMIGANLTRLDAGTRRLLTNPEVLLPPSISARRRKRWISSGRAWAFVRRLHRSAIFGCAKTLNRCGGLRSAWRRTHRCCTASFQQPGSCVPSTYHKLLY